MLILHTTEFEPQINDLNESDLAAAWAVLYALETPSMIIYNCGVEAGSSQGHKHLQIFPRQDGHGFQMFPEKMTARDGKYLTLTRYWKRASLTWNVQKS